MALVFLVLLTVIGILAINYSTTGLQIVGGMKQEAILAQTADSGIEQAKVRLWSLHPWNSNLTVGQTLADNVLETNTANVLLSRQRYQVRVDNVVGPDLVSVTVTATNQDTGQAKQVAAVLHYFATNPDQAGQSAENSNVIN